jgi:DNA polymerase-3 subunit alpha
MIDFVHLHRHSDHSALDGAGTAFQFAARAADLGQPYLAQTDHGNINGALKHLKACEQYGIIPIQGVESYWRPNRLVREADWRFRRWHLILLAINLKGWHNLIKITSEAFHSGMYQSPCVDWELLEQNHEGLICTASCALGPVAFLLENGTDAAVDDFIDQALKIFGERFFVEIMPHDWDRQRDLNLELVSLANRRGFGYYATVDSHYVLPDWASTQKIVALIGTNTTIAEAAAKNKERLANGEEIYELGHEGLHLMAGDEVRERFLQYHPNLGEQVVDRAIATTLDVARMVKPYITDRALKMPQLPAGIDPEQELIAWCREGMKRIGKEGDERYEKQLEYELSIIRSRNNFSYMWIVGDLVRWAKSDAPLPPSKDEHDLPRKKPIRLGAGRGSAAGSLVCYLSGITGVDPIAHKLKFERFMNPGRKGIQTSISISSQ